MKKEMLINVLQPEECRIAIVENGVLEELYVERTSQESYVGNIYKGRIVNIEPSIQAAFVDFGIGRNGFLHVSDVDPAYYRHLEPFKSQSDNDDTGGSSRNRRGRRNDRHDRRRPTEETRLTPSFEETATTEPGSAEMSTPLVDLTPTDALTPEVASPPPPRETQTIWGAALEILGLDLPESQPHSETPIATVPSAGESTAVEPIAPSSEALAEAAAPVTEVAAPSEPTESPERSREKGSRSRRGRARRDEEPSQESTEALPKAGAASSPLEHTTPSGPPPIPEASSFGAGIIEEILPPQPTSGFDSEVSSPTSTPSEPLLAVDSETVPSLVPPDEGLDSPQRQDAEAIAEEIAREAFAESFDDTSEEETASWNRHGEEVSTLDERSEDTEDDELIEGAEDDGGDVTQTRFRPRTGRGPRRGPRRGGRPGFGRPKPLIQDIFKRGQEVIVQVIKEGIGTKGPTLSTYISIAGRYLVLMPGLNRIGVSRKIVDEEARSRLKEILTALRPPKGIGFIIRTAGIDRNKAELQNDLAYLLRLWQVMVRRIKKVRGPAEIYQESDMITRTIRDVFTSDIDTIWVDEPNAFAHAQEFLQIVMPRYADRIKHYTDTEPLFYKYRIEEEIAKIQQKKIPLPMGGSIVIEQTEALVAIDVNSGNFRADGNNAEETAYQMNLQAAKEIARQLRLRDLGGVIVNDFIDMREEKHRRGVERALKEALKRDRARTKILRTSQFGLIEMTRQRIRPSLKRSVYTDCPHCNGTGLVKTVESMSIEVMRLLQLAAHRENAHRLEIRVHADVANYLLNRRRREIASLEEKGDMQVSILGIPAAAPETLNITCFDRNGHEVRFPGGAETPRLPDRTPRERRLIR
jgi:ribonuclease E